MCVLGSAAVSLATACNNLTLAERIPQSAAHDVPVNDADGSPAPSASAVTGGGDTGLAGGGGAALLGSPLCATPAVGAVCYPDRPASGAPGCGPVALVAPTDAGLRTTFADGGADAAAPLPQPPPLACRVAEISGVRTPQCSAAGAGIDGDPCSVGTDCAAGLECVGTVGTCRRYCCGGSCAVATEFCDIRVAHGGSGLTVPVCEPTTPCKLLADECGAGATCAVVRSDGTTGCVATGAVKEGDDCETDHCTAGHSCLGQPGSRRCYRLCSLIDPTSCGAGTTCRGSAPLFKDANVGVCE